MRTRRLSALSKYSSIAGETVPLTRRPSAGFSDSMISGRTSNFEAGVGQDPERPRPDQERGRLIRHRLILDALSLTRPPILGRLVDRYARCDFLFRVRTDVHRFASTEQSQQLVFASHCRQDLLDDWLGVRIASATSHRPQRHATKSHQPKYSHCVPLVLMHEFRFLAVEDQKRYFALDPRQPLDEYSRTRAAVQ